MFGGNPLSYFEVGQGIGAGNAPSLAGPQSVMDMFKMQQENAMKLQQTAALFKNEHEYEWSNSPQSREAQAKLNASGFGPGGSGGPQGNVITNAASGGAGGQTQTSGALGTNVPTSFTSITGQKYDNQNADVTADVIKKQLEGSSADAAGAALMRQKMDELRSLHDKALTSSGVTRAAVSPSPFGFNTRISQMTQAAQLASQGPDNPDWQNYENAKTNFSQMADRGLFGEKGKLTGQQIKAGQLLFPGKSGTKEGDEGLWNILYSIPKNTIDFHNQLVQKNLGAGSSAEIQSNAFQQATAGRADTARDASSTSNKVSREDAIAMLRKRGHNV